MDDQYYIDGTEMVIPKGWWKKKLRITALDIDSIEMVTTQGYLSRTCIKLKSGKELTLQTRWHIQLEELSNYAITNKINCKVIEAAMGAPPDEIVFKNNPLQ